MEDADKSPVLQPADNVNSRGPQLPPVRKLSTIAPKPQGFSLPALTDIIPFQGPRPVSSRNESVSGIPAPLFIPGVTELTVDDQPLKTYGICGKTYTMQKPQNEIESEFIRKTVDNRTLKYVLNVIQEPARARACGNGPRASTDRRPVDPPPVVRLNIYDLTEGMSRDVTMTYDSGFMLYASLEVARPIAHGRMQQPTHPPVLTGVAVASAAYLERCVGQYPAGYFIFPDLSVRHEGWYRLKFSLFEAVKHALDADFDRPFDAPAAAKGDRSVPHEAMANRMEVSSSPFQVFSAKKFPGLDQSTQVSKDLADQGCRVRIRREIRQRKRVSGDKKDSDSSCATPDVRSGQEHSRTHSIDSQHQGLRRGSMESYHTRTVPSRQPSIASITNTSPTTPIAHQMPMGPPVHRPSWDTSSMTSAYSSVTSYGQRWPSLPQPPSNMLPPMNIMPPMTSSHNATPRPRQYSTQEFKPSKRPYSPESYNQNESMKAGLRPDALIQRPYAPVGGNDIIEADDPDDEDSDYGPNGFLAGTFKWRRAEDKSWQTKQGLSTSS